MNFSRVSGGKISRYDLKHQKSVKDLYPVKYNQKKVGVRPVTIILEEVILNITRLMIQK